MITVENHDAIFMTNGRARPLVSLGEIRRRRKAAQSLHTIPDPMTARERAEREAASGEMS